MGAGGRNGVAGLLASTNKGVRWASERYLPFAPLGVDETTSSWRFAGGTSYPQFDRLLFLDLNAKAAKAVVALSVDGTAARA